jgi:NADH-quinone oxidoreductase subunit F
MTKITSPAELEEYRKEVLSKRDPNRPCIAVCTGTGCIALGAAKVVAAVKEEIKKQGLGSEVDVVDVRETGCPGFCERGPVMVIYPEEICYLQVQPGDAEEIVSQTIRAKKVIDRLVYADPTTGEKTVHEFEIPFYKNQKRLLIGNNIKIDPKSIDDYLAIGGYSALVKALFQESPEQVVDTVKNSGLRGRGGAGFSTGRKWEFARNNAGETKYVIVNADEGDPGAFMDRAILEGNPHSILEGLTIGAFAIGAHQGYIYVRQEYPVAIKNVTIAIEQAEEYGFLGKNILGSGFDFTVEVQQGAGAFVCGEETALLASLEGRAGEPKARPPYPAVKGLWGKPTNINNVETWANIPLIINKGADVLASIGTQGSKGTKIFSLVGKVNNTGLVEVPMGITLGDIIYKLGGGVPRGKKFKAVQTGGPSGGCIPAEYLGRGVDFDELAKVGAIMGSGGMIVMDEDTCMVDVARYFLSFLTDESCGKCVPCREGIRQMLKILTNITTGKGKMGDIERLEKLAKTTGAASLCALGKTAPSPVLSTLRYFRHEYEEHIKKHYCRAGVCKQLVKSPCQNSCPAGIDVPRYIRAVGDGKYGEAVAVIREKIPFPAICGYVCVHFCEAKCRRGELEEPIAIRELKRFAADHDNGEWKQNVKVASPTGKKVAIIGSGPAGLTAAYYSAVLGHDVTVFEALPKAGGMMRVGIPTYRLPAEVLDREIKEIENIGAKIKTNSRIDSLDELFAQGYDAIFVSVGAHQGTSMGIEGETTPKIVDGIDFLREVNLGKEVKVGEKVLVVGGGNVAIDASRTARRLKAKEVTIVYRRTRAEMPASKEEIDEALEEGVEIVYLATPTKAMSVNGNVKVEFIRMELGDVDQSGRRRPVPIAGSNFTSEYNLIVKAIGQESLVPGTYGLVVEKGGRIKVDPDTLATSRKGVYAGGDAVSGPASVIEAIAVGRQGAVSIDKYLGGTGNIEEVLAPPEEAPAPFNLKEAEGEKYRPPIKMLPLDQRLKGYAQVVLGFDQNKAKMETARCLRCDLEKR